MRTLFGETIQLGPPTVQLIGYNDSPFKNLGSIIVFHYHGDEKDKVFCEVADSSGHMILGKNQPLRMKYVDFPQIQLSTVHAKLEKTIKAVQKEQVEAATEPARPVIQWSIDSSVTIIGKTHQLLTTKGYLLKEYVNVFEVIGTPLGEEYHIQMKEEYKPVQHPK